MFVGSLLLGRTSCFGSKINNFKIVSTLVPHVNGIGNVVLA
jgi:hypothetical protein